MSREDQKRLLGFARQRALMDAQIERTDRRILEQQVRYNGYTANATRRRGAGNRNGALSSLRSRKLAEQARSALEERKTAYTTDLVRILSEEADLEASLQQSLLPEAFEQLEATRDAFYAKKHREFREQYARNDGVNLAEIAAAPEHAATLAGIRAGIENALADPAFNRLTALASRSLLGEPTAANERALNELMARQSAPGLGAGAGAAAVSTPTRVVVPGSAASYANVVLSPRTEAAAAVAPGPQLPFMSPYPIRIGGTSRRRRSGKSRRSRNKTARRSLRHK